MTQEHPKLTALLRRIIDRDMPIFGNTAEEVAAVIEDDKASVRSLSEAILHDSGMTARVLRLANSVAFNRSGQNISTISRATVVLGFDVVREMAFSVALIEALLKNGAKKRVVHEMARSIHAAVQARAAAVAVNDTSPEEVFIAALLLHLGDMAFWCFGEQDAHQLDKVLLSGVPAKDAELDVLGFRLTALTLGLAKAWKLNALLQSVLLGNVRPGSREALVVLSYSMASAAQHGWKTPEALKAQEQYARLFRLPADQVDQRVKENAAEATRIARCYGADAAADLIPVPGRRPPVEQAKPDPMLQMQILRELSALMVSRPSPITILELALEGIHRGIAMDRAMLAQVSSDRQSVTARLVLGRDRQSLQDGFHLSVNRAQPDLLTRVVDQQESQWGRYVPNLPKMLSPGLKAAIGEDDFFMAPVVMGDKSVAVFYADRQPSGQELTDDDWNIFMHFVQQATLGMTFVAKA